jgi:murein DD-endopeptidase MepM/ murein hydrolase activator NlpD
MANRHLSSSVLVTVLMVTLIPPPGRAAETAPDSATNAESTMPAALPSAVTPPAATPVAPAERPPTYTVQAGDSYWLIAQKFGCSVKQLKKINSAKKNNLKPGQVIKLPPVKSTAVEPHAPVKTAAKKHSTHKVAALAETAPVAAPDESANTGETTAPRAQPVQDFDVPTSTFASCPVPPPPDQDDVAPPVAEAPAIVKHTPRAEPAPETLPPDTIAAATPAPEVAPSPAPAPPPVAPKPAPAKPSFFAQIFHSHPDPLVTTPESDWAARFFTEARNLGDQGIEYDESWRPPGESRAWDMDCSNTSRYIYKVTTGIQLPRTASDQYYYLHLQQKAWDVPLAANGMADCDYLRQNLKAGDLLFWENTYKPERQPPITHVMVYRGTNEKGQWMRAGSQTGRGGEHNRRHGGPDIYIFDPTKPCGGYSTWLGMVHHQGRFCAYGRPLEADAAKLAVAAND